MLAAAQAAAAIPGEAIIIAALGTVGVVATALGPGLLERIRSRSTTEPAEPGAPGVTAGGTHAAVEATSHPASDALDMLEQSMLDLRQERDLNRARADRLDEEIRRMRADHDARVQDYEDRLDALGRQLHAVEIRLARREQQTGGWVS